MASAPIEPQYFSMAQFTEVLGLLANKCGMYSLL